MLHCISSILFDYIGSIGSKIEPNSKIGVRFCSIAQPNRTIGIRLGTCGSIGFLFGFVRLARSGLISNDVT